MKTFWAVLALSFIAGAGTPAAAEILELDNVGRDAGTGDGGRS